MKTIVLPMSQADWEQNGATIEGVSLLSLIGCVEGEILECLAREDSSTLAAVTDGVKSPDPFIMMAVGSLIERNLIVASRQGNNVLLTLKK